MYADFDMNQRMFKNGDNRAACFSQLFPIIAKTGSQKTGAILGKSIASSTVILARRLLQLHFIRYPYQALRRGTKRVLVYLLSLIGKSWPDRSETR